MALSRGTVVRSALREGPQYSQMFLSSRFSSPVDVPYASIPVIDALTIRDKKIKRLWLHAERANQNLRSADQFAAIACNLHSISDLSLSASEVPGPTKNLSKGNQRCESSLLPVSADTGHNLQLSKILVFTCPPPASRPVTLRRSR